MIFNVFLFSLKGYSETLSTTVWSSIKKNYEIFCFQIEFPWDIRNKTTRNCMYSRKSGNAFLGKCCDYLYNLNTRLNGGSIEPHSKLF